MSGPTSVPPNGGANGIELVGAPIFADAHGLATLNGDAPEHVAELVGLLHAEPAVADTVPLALTAEPELQAEMARAGASRATSRRGRRDTGAPGDRGR